jgi:hypothetical protein
MWPSWEPPRTKVGAGAPRRRGPPHNAAWRRSALRTANSPAENFRMDQSRLSAARGFARVAVAVLVVLLQFGAHAAESAVSAPAAADSTAEKVTQLQLSVDKLNRELGFREELERLRKELKDREKPWWVHVAPWIALAIVGWKFAAGWNGRPPGNAPLAKPLSETPVESLTREVASLTGAIKGLGAQTLGPGAQSSLRADNAGGAEGAEREAK